MTRSPLLYVAVAGAVALLLSGCGRKGGLDPPPGAWANAPTATAPGGNPQTSGVVVQPVAPPPTQEYGPDGKPIAPSGPNRRLPIDWLLN